jgi:hypothetical protein
VFVFPRGWFIEALIVFAFVAVSICSRKAMPRLVCPVCKLDAETEFVRFCPECGSDEVQTKGDDKYFLLWPRCRACGKELSRSGKGNRRLYRIRFCTRCGAYLDEEGL